MLVTLAGGPAEPLQGVRHPHRAGAAGSGPGAPRRGHGGAGRRAAGIRREHRHGSAVLGPSDRPPPPGSRALLDWLAGIIAPIDGDRPFGEDLERLIEAPWQPWLEREQ
jgi:hypothetical protein